MIKIIQRRPEVADEQVEIAVVVVVAPCATSGIAAVLDDRSVGDGCELRLARQFDGAEQCYQPKGGRVHGRRGVTRR